jgi:hypothetical protein
MTSPAQPHHPDSGPDPGRGDEAILRPLAEMIELTYNAEHMSLTDPRTRAAFDVAMGIAAKVTAGAGAQGIVDEAQQTQLAGLLEGARRAAGLVTDQ